MSALLSTTLYEYLTKHNDNSKTITIAYPFSLREPIKNFKDLKMNNDMVALPLDSAIIENLDDALVHYKKMFQGIKGSLYPFGILYAF